VLIMPQVFVSHCTQDADFARQIAAALREAGIEVWISPDSIRPGEEFVDAIQRGLSATTHFVLVMSPDAFTSNWVKLEMNTAIRLEREGKLEITPVLYRPCDPPLLLGNFQWVEYGGDPAALADRLAQWVGVRGAGAWSRPRTLSDEQGARAQRALDQLAAEVAACTRCPLHRDRRQAVPGAGPVGARLLLIGEAPGPEDDQTGQPFVSTAGRFLGELLEMIHVRREDVFLTNVVKCRPRQQRDPLPEEVRACADYLDRQIALIDPPVIVTLGTHALGRLLPGQRLSAIHGQPKQADGRLLFPTYHPAAGLYQGRYRTLLIKDFLEMERLLSARTPGA
jgi:DNA polymerase